MRVLSRSAGDGTADGNKGIKREGRITWRSGNEKWEVMKADKRERWRRERERERESKLLLFDLHSLAHAPSLYPPEEEGWNGGMMEKKKGWW